MAVAGLMGLAALCAMLAAMVLRRHLMLWRVFGPRLLFDCAALLVFDCAVLLL